VEVAVISVHSLEAYQACTELLRGRGFRLYRALKISRMIEQGERWSRDPDIIAINPAASERAKQADDLEGFEPFTA
jgi:hypothetical protein